MLAHGTDVTRLSVRPGPKITTDGFRRLLVLRPNALAAPRHHFDHRLHVLIGEAALIAQHLPQLAEYSLRQAQLVVRTLDEYLVAAADELLDAQRGPDLLQMKVAVAEQ